MNKDSIRNSINLAAEAAKAAPEKYEQATYEIILRHLLRSGTVDHPANRDGNQPVYETQRANGADHELLTPAPNSDNVIPPPAPLIAKRGKRTHQSLWAVMTLWNRNETPITASCVQSIIETELGKSPQNGTNTIRTLRGLVPRYIRRIKVGSEYQYEPTSASAQFFNNMVTERS
jgi:hypothetical protein